jgi:SAM-dependent methyltransferase
MSSTEIDVAWADSAGVETLRRMATVERYNRWIMRAVEAYVGRRILEVGCGIGNMTPFLLDADLVMCIDALPESVAEVRERFSQAPQVRAAQADIAQPASLDIVGREQYDTAVCINVLEHIDDDAAALRQMFTALAPGGHLLLYVPAGQCLYGSLDSALGHFRRYEPAPLRALVAGAGFDLLDSYYMNALGIPGWFLSGRILGHTTPPNGLLWLFNLLTPPLAWLERRWRPPLGQSLVCIARRPRG